MWVLLSILVFGGMYGLVGMLLAVPTTAVIYTLVREFIYERLANKEVVVTLNEVVELQKSEVNEKADV